MQSSVAKKLLRHSFWLSVLLHLLLLLGFMLVINWAPTEREKKPNEYVPSYVYKGQVTPTVNNSNAAHTQNTKSMQQAQNQKPVEERAKTSKQSKKSLPVSKHGINLNSILASTQSVLMQEQRKSYSPPKAEDPLYLIGDNNEPADPLIKMLGRALSANFEYPRSAGEFGITGRAVVGMTLHPGGYLTDIQLVKSSNNHDLDAAALYAVNRAPKVEGVDRFITEPKRFVIGFVFDTVYR